MIRFFHILTLILFIGLNGYGQGGDDANNKIKGIYMYQFAKNVNWANKEYNTGDFIIGVYGERGLYNQLSTTYSGKLVGSQVIKVKYFEASSNVTNCHILYIAKKNSSKVVDLSKKLKSGKTLIVSDEKGLLTSGSVINFIIKDSRIAFEISTTNAKKKELEIGQKLTKLATNVL